MANSGELVKTHLIGLFANSENRGHPVIVWVWTYVTCIICTNVNIMDKSVCKLQSMVYFTHLNTMCMDRVCANCSMCNLHLRKYYGQCVCKMQHDYAPMYGKYHVHGIDKVCA